MSQSGRLLVDFEHSLKTGTLHVWLDGTPIVDERLNSRVAKKIAGIGFREGGLEKLLAVSPGKHEIRVQVSWDDNAKLETISGTFEPGATRHLEIRIGRLRKNLSLEWQ